MTSKDITKYVEEIEEKQEREFRTNGYEKTMCEYTGNCKKAKDPDYFFTRCINGGDGCQIRYNLERGIKK